MEETLKAMEVFMNILYGAMVLAVTAAVVRTYKVLSGRGELGELAQVIVDLCKKPELWRLKQNYGEDDKVICANRLQIEYTSMECKSIYDLSSYSYLTKHLKWREYFAVRKAANKLRKQIVNATHEARKQSTSQGLACTIAALRKNLT